MHFGKGEGIACNFRDKNEEEKNSGPFSRGSGANVEMFCLRFARISSNFLRRMRSCSDDVSPSNTKFNRLKYVNPVHLIYLIMIRERRCSLELTIAFDMNSFDGSVLHFPSCYRCADMRAHLNV